MCYWYGLVVRVELSITLMCIVPRHPPRLFSSFPLHAAFLTTFHPLLFIFLLMLFFPFEVTELKAISTEIDKLLSAYCLEHNTATQQNQLGAAFQNRFHRPPSNSKKDAWMRYLQNCFYQDRLKGITVPEDDVIWKALGLEEVVHSDDGKESNTSKTKTRCKIEVNEEKEEDANSVAKKQRKIFETDQEFQHDNDDVGGGRDLVPDSSLTPHHQQQQCSSHNMIPLNSAVSAARNYNINITGSYNTNMMMNNNLIIPTQHHQQHHQYTILGHQQLPPALVYAPSHVQLVPTAQIRYTPLLPQHQQSHQDQFIFMHQGQQTGLQPQLYHHNPAPMFLPPHHQARLIHQIVHPPGTMPIVGQSTFHHINNNNNPTGLFISHPGAISLEGGGGSRKTCTPAGTVKPP